MIVENINIPDSWCNKLAQVQELDPNAMIAGGAIRDLYCGRPVKDVDIYSTVFPKSFFDHVSEGPKYRNPYLIDVVGGFDVDNMYHYLTIKPMGNLEILKQFDIGLCQIGFNGKEIILTPEFLWDVKYSVMTLRNIDRYSQSIKHYCRINQKYDYNLVIPQLETIINNKDRKVDTDDFRF